MELKIENQSLHMMPDFAHIYCPKCGAAKPRRRYETHAEIMQICESCGHKWRTVNGAPILKNRHSFSDIMELHRKKLQRITEFLQEPCEECGESSVIELETVSENYEDAVSCSALCQSCGHMRTELLRIYDD